MLRLSTVVGFPELGLRHVGSGPWTDPAVRWAHVSELEDPTPWLAGGELLLTTGVGLFRDTSATEDYCRRLAKAGIAALGVSTGRALPHYEIPEYLIEAASACGLPLLHVPEGTPLQAVVHRASDALNEVQTEPLRRALLAQRQLSEAAATPDGVAAVLRALAANTGFTSAVFDPLLSLVASTGTAAEAEFAVQRDEVAERMLEGIHWTITTNDGSYSSVVSPLGANGTLRGVMIAVKSGPLSPYDQAILSMVFSLLSVLLELRHSSAYKHRQARGHAIDSLLAGGLTDVQATVRLAKVGLECGTMQCVLMPSVIDEAHLSAVVAGLAETCTDVLVRQRSDETVLLLCDPGGAAAEQMSRLAVQMGASPVGMGTAVDPAAADMSLRQARRARDLALSRSLPFVALPETHTYKTILAIGDAVERANFADTILGTLDEYDDRRSGELVRALGAYVGNTSNIEAAANQLGIHRHTMRARLAKIIELTGRDLGNAPDLLELWLAYEFREIARSERIPRAGSG